MYVLRPLTSGRQAARASEASESQSVSMLNKKSSARTADEDVQEEAAAELVPFKRTAMLTPCPGEEGEEADPRRRAGTGTTLLSAVRV